MDSRRIKALWVEYFRDRLGHRHLPSAPLVPDNPTLLLTNAGMVPFVPCFLGYKEPPASRVVSVQRCVRVGGKDSDLENIGKTSRHLSFFEMLGNFSFGDYFKEQAIPWAWELMTEVYGLPSQNLAASIFAGDDKTARDHESYRIWREVVGLSSDRIWEMGRQDNFWGPPGTDTGPCGPCSEIHYLPPDGSPPVELWNLVFMEYEQLADGSLSKLATPNVDTGAGLERLATVLQGKTNVFETDLLAAVLDRLPNSQTEDVAVARRVIADHVRCAAIMLSEGIRPGNVGRGYVLRMLIRRAARFGRSLGFREPFLAELVGSLREPYPELADSVPEICKQLTAEESAFAKTIERGLSKFRELADAGELTGDQIFDLHATYGLPAELTADLAAERGLSVDWAGFEDAKREHARLSSQGKFSSPVELSAMATISADLGYGLGVGCQFVGYDVESIEDAKVLDVREAEGDGLTAVVLDRTPFYAESGGQLADTGCIGDGFRVEDVRRQGQAIVHLGRGTPPAVGDAVSARIDRDRRAGLRKHHTATHLLHAALRGAFGEDVQQAGSLVAPDRLRFDFTLARAPTEKELRQVEDTVRRQIQADLPVCAEEMEFEAAMARGALAFFGDKYGDRVRVVQIGGDDVSLELCGGTHVAATSEIGDVRLESSEAVSRGTRRLEMIAGQALQQRLREHYDVLQEVASELKVPPREVPAAVRELKEAKKHLAKARKSLSLYRAEDLLQAAEGRLLRAKLPSDIDLKDALDHLGKKLGPESVVFLVQVEGGKLRYGARVGKSAPFHASADDLVRDFAAATGGSGGGKGQFAQGGGGEPGLLEAGWRALAKRLETP